MPFGKIYAEIHPKKPTDLGRNFTYLEEDPGIDSPKTNNMGDLEDETLGHFGFRFQPLGGI